MGHINLTYKKARDIQEGQIIYYSRGLSDMGRAELRRLIMEETEPCEDRDVERSIFEINEMVPRGGWFEHEEIIHLRMVDRYHGRYRLDFATGI